MADASVRHDPMRVVFRNLNHWEQEHDLETWPDRDAVVELKSGAEGEFYKVSGVKWVLTDDERPPCVVVDLVPARFGRSI
jgi:hypothetical protein